MTVLIVVLLPMLSFANEYININMTSAFRGDLSWSVESIVFTEEAHN